ncbi:MAG TPA: SusC/RagA family TonB-linked outer membrane protein, partial [Chitinophagaceae bacterium]|nr:SusC/RagA family TonB-linked outer membrane protein [Chitinophagaceae bacterium]
MKNVHFSIVIAIMKITAIPVLILLGSFCALAREARGQDELSKNVTITVANKELKAVLKEVGKMTGVKFLYSREIIQSERKISVAVKEKPLSEFLTQILSPLHISFELDKNGYIFLNTIVPAELLPEPAAAGESPGPPPRKINGTITATDGTPVDGASVQVKGGAKGTATDKDGHFALLVAETDKILVITALGYEKRELNIAADSSYTVKLVRVATSLDDVVVIGYGEQKRKDVTGAIGSIKAEDIKNVPQTGIDQMLQGRVAGVSVTQNSGEPGGGVSVRIRGVTTLQSNNEPLYVIDGIPVDGNSNNDILTLAGDGENKMSALSGLNPSDILSVDILKDASAAAIYGNRAANGVVLITTKKGKSGEGKIAFNTYQGVQKVYKYLDLLDLKGYATYKNSIADYIGGARQPEFADLSLLGKGTDWQKEIFTPAIQQNYDLSVSGGKPGGTYYISGNYYKQDGTIIGSGFTRKSVRLNMDNQVKNWFKVGVNATYSTTDQQVTLANTVSGIVAMAIQQSPDVPVFLADGSFGGPNDQTNFGAVGVGNPVAQAKSWKTNLARNKLMSDVYGQISFLKNFTFRTDFGTDMNWNTSSTFLPTYNWGSVVNTLNKYNVQTSNSSFWNIRNVLTYHVVLQKHDITAMAGQEANKSKWDNITSSRSNFPSNDITSLNLGDPTSAGATENRGQATQESYFARAIYSYDSRFALTATIRRDQSSKFAPGHQVGYFPAVSGAWTLTHEKF